MDIDTLQRLMVNALEDVKGQDIQVFDTEHLSPLFSRVVLATGSSNRQTRALAERVREMVKSAGGHVGNMEGEDSGEWVLLDCEDAILHVMLPTFREYYNLEEIWGERPVSLAQIKGVSTALPSAAKAATRKTSTKTTAKKAAVKKTVAKTVTAKKTTAKKTPAKKSSAPSAKAVAKKTATKKAAAKKPVVKKPTPRSVASKKQLA